MRKIPILLAAALISFPALADQHGAAEAEVRAAMEAFNAAYAGNDVDAYFDYYVDDAMVYFYGSRQDVAAYHEEWTATIAAGNAVEKNELSDVRIRMLPGGEAAITSYFVEFRMRGADGTVSESNAFESEVWQKINGAWKIVALHYTEIAPDE